MAWPQDRLRTYAPNSPVHADDLNQLQDASVDLHSERRIVLASLNTAFDGSGNPYWQRDKTNPEHGWLYAGGLVPEAWFDVELPGPVVGSGSDGAIVTGMAVKFYNADPSNPVAPPLAIYKIDCNLGVAATAPAKGSAVAAFSSPTHDVAASSWGVQSLAGLSITVSQGHRIMIEVGSPTTLSKIACVELTYYPVTST